MELQIERALFFECMRVQIEWKLSFNAAPRAIRCWKVSISSVRICNCLSQAHKRLGLAPPVFNSICVPLSVPPSVHHTYDITATSAMRSTTLVCISLRRVYVSITKVTVGSFSGSTENPSDRLHSLWKSICNACYVCCCFLPIRNSSAKKFA